MIAILMVEVEVEAVTAELLVHLAPEQMVVHEWLVVMEGLSVWVEERSSSRRAPL